MQPLVTISVIHFSLKDGFSTKHHIAPLFESLAAQTYKNVEIFCVDNASTDEEAKDMVRTLPGVTPIFLKENRGTCVHNEVFARARGSYLWCVTLDTRYEPDFLEKLVQCAEQLPKGASFGGALRYLQEGQGEIADTLGIAINRFHSFRDRYQRQPYNEAAFPAVEEVFGISGASVLFRMDALRDIALPNGEIWDERFFMYYEDVDVSYRLQWRGWRSYLVHAAKGWHVRTLVERHVAGGRIARILSSRRYKSNFYRYYANRNKLWLLWRNFRKDFSLHTKVATSLEIAGRLAWIVVFERTSWRAVQDGWKERHALYRQPALPDEKTAAKRIESFMGH